MSDILEHTIKTAVATWLAEQLNIIEIVSYVFPDEDEVDRFIVVFAAKGQDMWRAVEAWVENDAVISINDLGEGVPPDGVGLALDLIFYILTVIVAGETAVFSRPRQIKISLRPIMQDPFS